MIVRTGIGKASRRFLPQETSKPCILAGVIFDGVPGLGALSDGDVIFHAVCSAISSVSGTQVLNAIAEELLEKDGITDSRVYLERGMKVLGDQKVSHVAISLEGKLPVFKEHIETMRASVASAMGLGPEQVGITAISGEGLTDFSCGDGIQCLAVITTEERT